MQATTHQGATAHGNPKTTNTARQIHDDVEQALGCPVAHRHGLRGLTSHQLKHSGKKLWCAMKRHPFMSVVALAVSGAAAASAVGVAEIAFGTVVALAAYKVLREGEPPLEAIEGVQREAHA